MKNKMFEGIATALVTPFKDNKVDEKALRKHINFQIDAGIHCLLPCGTTGESPTLNHDEHKNVIAITVDEVKGRVPVMAGAGSNSTLEAIELAQHAQSVGADALLLVSPYYNKPTQEGLYQHFSAIANKVPLPIIMYNIPGRCAVNILPETIARLAQNPQFIGVKEATGDLNQMIRTIELCGDNFMVTSGDDGLTLPLLAVGGRGVISVCSNIIPKEMVAMWNAWESKDLEKAKKLFFKMLPLFKTMFLETNPIPIKTALHLMGRMESDLRLPMCQPSAETVVKLKQCLKEWELI